MKHGENGKPGTTRTIDRRLPAPSQPAAAEATRGEFVNPNPRDGEGWWVAWTPLTGTHTNLPGLSCWHAPAASLFSVTRTTHTDRGTVS